MGDLVSDALHRWANFTYFTLYDHEPMHAPFLDELHECTQRVGSCADDDTREVRRALV